MIELTEQLRQALLATEAPQLVDARTGKTYVLVPTEVYERLKGLLEDEPRVTGEMVDHLMAEEDRDDPTRAFYQQEFGCNPTRRAPLLPVALATATDDLAK